MKKTVLIAALTAAVMAAAACADGKQSSSNTGTEKSSLPSPGGNGNNGTASTGTNTATNSTPAVQNNFYTSAARGGIAEVEMSKIAETKATNAEIKKFARMMVADHTKANADLKTLAAARNIVLPVEPSASHKSVIEELKGLSGADFDRTYVNEMVEDHEADVQLFEGQAQDESDPEAKAFAAKTLPTLQKHLEMIRGIQSRLQ